MKFPTSLDELRVDSPAPEQVPAERKVDRAERNAPQPAATPEARTNHALSTLG